MTVDRAELIELVKQLPDEAVGPATDELRRRIDRPQATSWPPEFFGMGEIKDGPTDISLRVDELLAEGFGRD